MPNAEAVAAPARTGRDRASVEVLRARRAGRAGADRHQPRDPRGRLRRDDGAVGSGKSTLLNLIAGIDKPDAGRLSIAGDDITQLGDTELADWRARTVGFIFQFYNLMPVLTAFENVELPLQLTTLSRVERRERVELLLGMVGLADRMKHYPNELSAGSSSASRSRGRW